MDWYERSETYHSQTFSHECRLSSLPEEWQRELAAIWRLEAEINNGGYLQFLVWWGRESYEYASRALHKIGAHQMAKLVDNCQALVDEHFHCEGASREQMESLMPNPVIIRDGERIESAGSILPEAVIERIYALSYEFMSYPDDIAKLGLTYYRSNFPTS